MRATLVSLITVLAMAGCAAQAARDPDTTAAPVTHATSTNLDGTEWRFVEVAGTMVPAGVRATLRLHNGHASGKAGCNAYGATYETAADGSVKFGAAMSTKMACLQPAGVMQVEQRVLEALRLATRIERHDGDLVLFDASGKPLAKLLPASR
jgi:heat shock protein HslJ